MSDEPTADYDALFTAQDQDDPVNAARGEARQAVDATVIRMARAAGAEIRERSALPGSLITTYAAAPSVGIRMALMLRSSVDRSLYDYIRHGREDGLSWTQIGEALNLRASVDERGYGLGDAAFDFAVDAEHADRFQTLSFGWTCPACHAYISDRGPNGRHPEDDEPGHEQTCSRQAAAVAAYDARWADA
jgi:hypothetical protein